MDNSTKELAAVEQAISESNDRLKKELVDLQLAMLGGGTGETILI
jgi:hypothetical protein